MLPALHLEGVPPLQSSFAHPAGTLGVGGRRFPHHRHKSSTSSLPLHLSFILSQTHLFRPGCHFSNSLFQSQTSVFIFPHLLDCSFQLGYCFPCTCALFSMLLWVLAGVLGMQHRFPVPHIGSHWSNRDRDRSWVKAQMSWLQPGCFSGIPTLVPWVPIRVVPTYH